jgi:hypothetical protein
VVPVARDIARSHEASVGSFPSTRLTTMKGRQVRNTLCSIALIGIAATFCIPSGAQVFTFSTGPVTDSIASASRPDSPGKVEIEAADDFVVGAPFTQLNSATFTGLVPTTSNITNVRVEIYRVFPLDSTVPPSGNVPTRNNSPSDVAFDERDANAGQLSFTTTTLNANFTAQNSVLNGINKSPNQRTMGEGPVSGQEVQFNIDFTDPFILPGDHYFFIPQVQLDNGDFFWLSGSRPIVAPGTPFPAGATDLQEWIRNGNLDPDWLRVGTDIVGGSPAPQFNGAFSLAGQAVPEPGSIAMGAGSFLCGAAFLMRRRLRKR